MKRKILRWHMCFDRKLRAQEGGLSYVVAQKKGVWVATCRDNMEGSKESRLYTLLWEAMEWCHTKNFENFVIMHGTEKWMEKDRELIY